MRPETGKKYAKTAKKVVADTNHLCTIRCACGAVYHTGSTKKDITIEICSKCHPFYTGKQKLVDTSGRVDKFNRKYGLN